MPPTPEWITLTVDLGVLDLGDLALGRLDRALHVGLDDQAELLDGALLHRREQILEADGLAAPREHLGAQPLGALLRDLAGDAVVLDHAAELAGRRRLVEAEDLDRQPRPGVLDALAVVIVQRLDLAPGVAGDDRVADAQRAPLHQHRGDRAAADVQARLDDDAAGVGASGWPSARARPPASRIDLEQLVEVLPGLGRDVHEDRLPAPLLRLQALVDELVANPLGVARRACRSCSRRPGSARRRPWHGRSPRSSAASRRRRRRPPAPPHR